MACPISRRTSRTERARAARSASCKGRGRSRSIRGREYALVEDVQALARDALRHRLVLSYQALAEEVSPDAILDQVLAAVPAPQLDLATRERRLTS